MKGIWKKVGLMVFIGLMVFSGDLFAGGKEIRGKVIGYNPVDESMVLRVGVHGIAGQGERDLSFDVSGAEWLVCLGGSCAELDGEAGFRELGFYRSFGAYGIEPGEWTAILKTDGEKVSAVRVNIR